MVPFSSCMSLVVFCILFLFQLLKLLKSSTNEVYFSFSVYQFFKNFIECINIQGCYVLLFINWPLSHQGMAVFIFTNISCFRIYFVSDFLQIGISFCIFYFFFILTHLCYYIYSKYFKYLVVFFKSSMAGPAFQLEQIDYLHSVYFSYMVRLKFISQLSNLVCLHFLLLYLILGYL